MSTSQTPEPVGAERTLRSAVRNPRRRQRQSDGDSLRTAAPRRKRSKLSDNTFVARGTPDDTESVASSANMNGHPKGGSDIRTMRRRDEGTPMSLDPTELPVRGTVGKKTATVKHRAFKGDGATVLTQNKVYSAKLLPSTPKELRQSGVEYRGSLGGGHHALAVTRKQAIVWDYTAHTTVSNARVFDLPFPVKEGQEIPFGALVTSGASTDLGLLLVSATTGRVVFYESIERAASLGLFQKHQTGVEGVVTGFSAPHEIVTELVSADHAGWILTLSSGRIIHLTLRDAQGKARIFTQPLRPEETNSGGIFGSIRNFWSGAWKKDVTALKTRALDQRGQMQAVALTERCELQIWDLNWSGRYEFRSVVDLKETIGTELKSLYSVEQQSRAENVTAVDFVILDTSAAARGHEIAALGAEQQLSFWLLVRIGTSNAQEYALMELSLSGENASVERTMKLESYFGASAMQKPKLLLPRPGHTAMIMFEDAIALLATSGVDVGDDPNAQLHEASYIEPQPFEDVVQLRHDKGLAMMGMCAEETRSGHSASLAFVRGAGLVRLSATDPSGDVERSRVPVKSKIEQAVFYGAMQENILDFSRKEETPYSTGEVETAALELSGEIFLSGTHFISANPTSIETHLEYRARALKALASHVRRNYPALSPRAMWQLLWDAERVAAAKELWRAFEEHREAVSKVKRTATVLDEMCSQLEEKKELPDVDESGDPDPVRRFFVKGLNKLDHVLSLLRHLLETLEHSQELPPEKIVLHVAEADDLWARTMETVFEFRTDNSATYGIPPEFVPEGVLNQMTEYTDLPEFWSSTEKMLKSSSIIASLSRKIAKQYFEEADDENAASAELEESIKNIAQLNPRLIQICCLLYKERIDFLCTRHDKKDVNQGKLLLRNFSAERHDQFRALTLIGAAEQGMLLAERYRDMHTLTELIVMESQYFLEELHSSDLHPDQKAVCQEHLEQIEKRISRYFDKFGDEWANAFFDEAFSGSRAGMMLDEAQNHWREALTRYLRAEPGRARICWLNDILGEKAYGHAGTVLSESAAEQETRLWAKKVELSMGKLSLLAAQEGKASRPPAAELRHIIQRPQRELRIVDVQERLTAHVRSEVISALDSQAELELVIKRFGTRTQGFDSLNRLLETLLERLLSNHVLSVDELIDVLTLMDSVVAPHEAERSDRSLEGQEFVLALQALEAAAPSMDPARFHTLLQLIWKRCFVSDDWAKITTAQTKKGKTDAEAKTALRQTVAWRTFFHLFTSQVLDDDSAVRVLAPNECLGAACKSEDLAHRFPGDLLDHLLHDNRVQDELLAGFVADRRLDQWVADAQANAREAAEETVAASIQVQAEEARMEDQVQRARMGKIRGGADFSKANGDAAVLGNGVHDVDGDLKMQ
ncbi:hypothetical protein KC348_g9246 [Hortaea werneckii]|uniref:Nucleoporin Nup133/Nup155-like C-terminal domain-containing protein n=1 Tax=Hortaea werneckii EXF-2000 TaxID=1157616 RepID=A0A1Z5SR72_HORWE|nr:hypothetical protein KC358_g15518 [Hortaea werneckii]OTA23310.1 hypothetical protein BTJ68_13134 [Hortaea werneckii EXF-2000]KAI6921924.1 hypothetical protein KC341_g15677 [Hortaea werneckii]KAI6924517.1 hypothetical protein KC348_g9246 [Hortaea werneckii]KAI6967339.1 hypothetical protein KC321_g9074 [Hortaea werneckii]